MVYIIYSKGPSPPFGELLSSAICFTTCFEENDEISIKGNRAYQKSLFLAQFWGRTVETGKIQQAGRQFRYAAP